MLKNTQNYVLLRNSCIFAPIKQWRDLSSLQPRKKMLNNIDFLCPPTLNSYPPFGFSFLIIIYQFQLKNGIRIHIRIGV